MTHYSTIFFDLDGTLTDPKEGITKSIQYALKKFGITVDNLDHLIPFIGPPLYESFMQFYGFDKQTAFQAVDFYREYFSERGMYENKPYEGMGELLADLKGCGKKLFVATSKPTVFSEKILKHFGMDDFFQAIVGSELDGSRIHKHEIIEFLLQNFHPGPKEQIVMVGDREFDILGAKSNGIHSIGVAYGYGSREELENAGPDFIVGSIAELKQQLLYR